MQVYVDSNILTILSFLALFSLTLYLFFAISSRCGSIIQFDQCVKQSYFAYFSILSKKFYYYHLIIELLSLFTHLTIELPILTKSFLLFKLLKLDIIVEGVML